MLRGPHRVVTVGALALLVLVSGPGAGRVSAQTPPRGGMTVVSGGREAEPDKWWGVAGAMMCGWGMRFIRVAPEIGMNPYVLAATIGGCILALMDQL